MVDGCDSLRKRPMTQFVDPRSDPDPKAPKPPPRTTTDPDELAELHRLCREGRLYDVERWIRAGKPLQMAEDASGPAERARFGPRDRPRGRKPRPDPPPPLQRLRPERRADCPLDQVLRARGGGT